jgi:hypothetical protein
VGEGHDDEPALAFALDYAHSSGRPSEAHIEALVRTYGRRTAHDLITYVRLAAFAAMSGNTCDALISRLLGQASPRSTLAEELKSVLILGFGVLPIAPLLMLRAGLCGDPGPLTLGDDTPA